MTTAKTSTPGKLSPEALARIQQLTGQMSQAQIADRLRAEGLADVSREAVGAAIRRGPAKARRQRLDARTPQKPSQRQQPPDVAQLSGDLDTLPHELVVRRLAEVSGFADAMHEAGNVIAYRDLVKLEAEIAGRLEAMRPPPAPDPELDPANAIARDETRRRIEDLVSAAEDRR